MASNKDLNKANKAKKDEFYTMLADIEVELKHYRKHFKGKTVLCNCDDPFESNFFKYFAMNFNYLGLKKLIATCYQGSPVLGEEFEQLSMFELDGETPKRHPYKIEITEVVDSNGDGAVDLTDVEYLLRNKKNALTLLTGDGDFRSDECVEILKEADIVVTNPPFSLFREFISLLFQYEKKFLIIGNMTAVTYKDVFPLVRDNRMWLGYSIHSGDREFRVPDDYPLEAAGYRVDEKGRKFIRVKGVRWWTNMEYVERHTDLDLWRTYDPLLHPTCDNYDAIDISATTDIPDEYFGLMCVPISFLDKYNPDQFEILDMTDRDSVYRTKTYTKEDAKNYSDLNRRSVLVLPNGTLKGGFAKMIIRRRQNGNYASRDIGSGRV